MQIEAGLALRLDPECKHPSFKSLERRKPRSMGTSKIVLNCARWPLIKSIMQHSARPMPHRAATNQLFVIYLAWYGEMEIADYRPGAQE